MKISAEVVFCFVRTLCGEMCSFIMMVTSVYNIRIITKLTLSIKHYEGAPRSGQDPGGIF